MKFPRLRNPEIDLIKTDVEEIKTQLGELLVCLPAREAQIMAALEANKVADDTTADLIAKQEAAIKKLEDLNCEKSSQLHGMHKWIILAVLGILSLTVRYTIQYEPGTGTVIRPDQNAGAIMPVAYTVAIIAVATNHDRRIGDLIDRMGAKIGG